MMVLLYSMDGELWAIKQEHSRYYWQPEPYFAFAYWGCAVSLILLYAVFAVEDSIFNYKGLFLLAIGLVMIFLGSRRQMYFQEKTLYIRTWLPIYREKIPVANIEKINYHSRHLMMIVTGEKRPRVYLMNQKRQVFFLKELATLQQLDN